MIYLSAFKEEISNLWPCIFLNKIPSLNYLENVQDPVIMSSSYSFIKIPCGICFVADPELPGKISIRYEPSHSRLWGQVYLALSFAGPINIRIENVTKTIRIQGTV